MLYPQIYYPLEEMAVLYMWVLLSAALRSQNGLKWSHPMFAVGAYEGHLLGSIKKEQRNLITELVMILRAVISQSQVLDVVLNRPSENHFKKQYKRWVCHGHQNICLEEDELLFKRKSCLDKWALVSLETTSRDNITHDSFKE